MGGWEDVVIVLPAEQERPRRSYERRLSFAIRIAMLQLAFFGTTYGGDVDNLRRRHSENTARRQSGQFATD